MRRWVLFTLLAWAAYVPLARAQFECTVTSGTHIEHAFYFNYGVFSCKGKYCLTAAHTLPDTTTLFKFSHLILLRSVDGGHTWLVQDPGISDPIASVTGIDQIDSMNIVVYGNGGGTPEDPFYVFILRTTDGGANWKQVTPPVPDGEIKGISFSTPEEGILTGYGSVFHTTDGGTHWNTAPFSEGGGWQCQDYGDQHDRLFRIVTGETYTTTDGWHSYDSTGPIVSDSGLRSQYMYDYCSFGMGDTMLAYGWHNFNTLGAHACIARTTDGGRHWATSFDDTTYPPGYVYSMSDVDRDTIVAGGTGYQNAVLRSTDNGRSWKMDSLLCADTSFSVTQNNGIGLNSEGELCGAFNGFSNTPGEFGTEALIIGRKINADVASTNRNNGNVVVFPNPSTTSITIRGMVHLFDAMGRNVQTAMIATDGAITEDISPLPTGLYFIRVGTTQTKFVKK